MKSLLVAVATAALLAFWSSNGRAEISVSGPFADNAPASHYVVDI